MSDHEPERATPDDERSAFEGRVERTLRGMGFTTHPPYRGDMGDETDAAPPYQEGE